jgi:hypothetical protein
MFNVKDLEAAILAVQEGPKLPKGIKVTTFFWNYLKHAETPFEMKCAEFSARFNGYMGLPVEIDDEIDGYYKVIY